MRTIKLILSFDGTAYSGWQRQRDVATVQGTVEKAISVMIRVPVVLHGAGRTDAGVHALAMVAHFKTEASISCSGFLKGLNSLLPRDIRILSVADVKEDFHARFCAKGKVYRYNFVTSGAILPTERLYHAHLPAEKLDFYQMGMALEMLVGEHDFSSFEKSGSRDLTQEGGRGAVRTIFQAGIRPNNPTANHFIIEIHGNGFLRHMVRNIVGTLYEVGLGRWNALEFKAILVGKNRALAGRTAPANGLFLMEVFY